jgi:hypothetical protein
MRRQLSLRPFPMTIKLTLISERARHLFPKNTLAHLELGAGKWQIDALVEVKYTISVRRTKKCDPTGVFCLGVPS